MVIIGAGMGGLSAAIYARLAGYDVLVLEKSTKAGGKAAGITIGEYQLDPGPSIIILPKIYEAVFAAAGRRMSDYLTFQPLDVISRVFFGDNAPLDLPSNAEGCYQILRDINPSDAAALKTLIQKLEKIEPLLDKTIYDHPYIRPSQLLDVNLLKFGMGFSPFKTYKELVDSLFTSPMVKAFFYGFPSYGGQTYTAKSPGAFLIPYYMLTEGVYFPKGGVRQIPIAFQRLAEELGVEFRFGVEVTKFEGDDRKLRALTTSTGERISADAFISNLDRFTFAGMRQQEVIAEPSFSYFTVHRGIKREFSQLQHHNLVLPASFERGFEELYSEGKFPTEPIVYVNSTGGLDPEAAPNGSSNIFSVVTSPAKVDGINWPKSQHEYMQRVDRELEKVGIQWTDSEVEFERIQTPEYFESEHGSYRGSLYGLHESERLWGMFPASNKDDQWDNVAYCGGSVQPGAGLPMVTLSGKFAVDVLR
ncbi:MAG TPA: phytoene desaturase family protein [Fimbriimonas sp.]|nr:phytoene desaturase family protein [Fimbriimonas sp.]